MATRDSTQTEEALTQELNRLRKRIEALESVFSERVLDREQGHVEAKEQDAREQFEIGDIHRIMIDSPPGTGRDGTVAVGNIEGVVTFVDPMGMNIDKNDVLRVQLKDVQENSLNAVPVERS